MQALFGYLGLIPLLVFTTNSATADSERELHHRRIAELHAPIIYHELGSRPRADLLTRFDFDHDFVAENNEDNLDKFSLPAHVYFSVCETRTHYFVHYAFFHPLDYKKAFPHENDLEGALLVIDKESSPEGAVRFVETQAHTRIDYNSTPVLADGRTVLYIEPKGHGVHSWTSRKSFVEFVTGSKPRVVYSYGGVPDVVDNEVPAQLRYDLIPIADLWDRIGTSAEALMYQGYFRHTGGRYSLRKLPGEFKGKSSFFGGANPPWAWSSAYDSDMARGDWFLDPAFAVSRHYREASNISLEYVYNYFLKVSGAGEMVARAL